MSQFVAFTASGLAFGAIYSLVALGFLILYKATGIFNFAQGELLTLGAYVAYWGINDLHLPDVAAYALSVVLLFAVGVLLERVAYAPLRGQSFLVIVIATLGASFVIEGLIALWFGGNPHALASPTNEDVLHLFGAAIAIQRVVIVVITILALCGMGVLLYRTQLGRQLRALADDRETAQLQGIRVTRLSMFAFGLSSAVSALGGVLIALLRTSIQIWGSPSCSSRSQRR